MPDTWQKGCRSDQFCSSVSARSLALPGLRFLDEFAFATRLFHDCNRSTRCFLNRLFRFFIIWGSHLDSVYRRSQIQQLNINTGYFRLSAFQCLFNYRYTIGQGTGEDQVPGYFDPWNFYVLLGNMEKRISNLFGKIELFERRFTVNNEVFKNGMESPVLFEDQILQARSRLAGLFCNKTQPLPRFTLILPFTNLFASLVFVDIF